MLKMISASFYEWLRTTYPKSKLVSTLEGSFRRTLANIQFVLFLNIYLANFSDVYALTKVVKIKKFFSFFINFYF